LARSKSASAKRKKRFNTEDSENIEFREKK